MTERMKKADAFQKMNFNCAQSVLAAFGDLTGLNDETAKKIAGKVINITARGAEGGRLYGSVTSAEIAAALEKQYGVKVEKRRVDVKNIRNAGEYNVSVWLFAGITAEMTAKVEVAVQ